MLKVHSMCARRLRQQLQQQLNATGAPGAGLQPGNSSSGLQPALGAAPVGGGVDAQFLRLPLESAKKLRWFDKQDLNMLIQLHLREKAELLDANAALRGVRHSELHAGRGRGVHLFRTPTVVVPMPADHSRSALSTELRPATPSSKPSCLRLPKPAAAFVLAPLCR